MAGMTIREILQLVEDYIGTTPDGYLCHFSYSKHESFYHTYCDLDLDVKAARARYGSTRKTFVGILKDAAPRDQAKIIRGIFAMLPPSDEIDEVTTKKVKVHQHLLQVISRLEADGVIELPPLSLTTETIFEALKDAEALLRSRGPSSAVDRAHTALHAYLKKLCADRNATVPKDPSITALFKAIREQLSQFKDIVAHDEEAKRLLGSMSTALDSLNTLRNRGTLAHPNELLLESAEAMLYINLSRAVLAYLDTKMKASVQA